MMKKKRYSLLALVLGGLLLLSALPVCAEEATAITADSAWPTRADGSTPAGTKEDPFLVEDAADFMAIASKRASYNSFAGKYIKLTADIDLNPDWDANTKTKPATTWTAMWTFSGTIDGDGHTVKGLYAVANAYSGFIRNCTNGAILNLTVDNSYIEGTYSGFISCLKSGSATLQNITFGKDYIVKGTTGAGGLVGQVYSTDKTEPTLYEYDISECVFHGQITTNGNYAGGFVGNSNGFTFNFDNCYVDGTITAVGTYAGGLMANVSRASSISNCAFDGTVTAGTYAGGLVARTSAKLTVTDCSVKGTLSATEAVAGICPNVAGIITLTRAYGETELKDATYKAGLLSEKVTTEVKKTLADCYFKADTDLEGVVVYNETKATPSALAVTYTSSSDTALKTATEAELLTFTAFTSNHTDYFGWVSYLDMVMPATLMDHFTGHDFTAESHDATCVAHDYVVYTCKNCGYSYTVTGTTLAEHTSTGTIVDAEPTETVGGKSHDVCAVCQQIFDEKYIPVEGAVYSYNASWENGTKDSADKTYEIATAQDLMAFAYKRSYNNSYAGATVVLTADIDLNPGWDASSGLVPPNVLTYIFSFDGTFEGNGHTISGLYCVGNSGADYQNACFINKLNGATVRNLKVTNSYFVTDNSYAGLFINAINATVTNVYADVIVGADKYAGGICAQVTSGNTALFENCVFAGTVEANQYAGGVVGWNGTKDASGTLTLKNCANYGAVTCPDCSASLVGRTTGTVILENCLASGSVSDTTKNGIITVSYAETSLTVKDTYYMGDFGELEAVNRGTGDTYHLSYEGQTVTAEQSVATPADLIAKTAFAQTWAVYAEKNMAVPTGVYCYVAGHQWKATDKTVTATCIREGYTLYQCEYCQQTYKGDIQAMTDHTPADEWVIDQEPTEKRMGSKHLECTVCHEIIKSEILAKLQAETTEAVTTEETATTEAPATKGGCASLLTASALPLLLLALAGVWLALDKKKVNR